MTVGSITSPSPLYMEKSAPLEEFCVKTLPLFSRSDIFFPRKELPLSAYLPSLIDPLPRDLSMMRDFFFFLPPC